jgi:hypothetical protein
MLHTAHAPRTHAHYTSHHPCMSLVTSLSHNSDARPTPPHHGHWHLVTDHALKPQLRTQYNIAAILPFLIFNAYIHVYTVQITTTMSRNNAMRVPVFPSETCDTTTSVGEQLQRGRNHLALMLPLDWSHIVTCHSSHWFLPIHKLQRPLAWLSFITTTPSFSADIYPLISCTLP